MIKLASNCRFSWVYCDTPYAGNKKGGEERTINEIIWEIGKIRNKNITITGGEPLLQEESVNKLAADLLIGGYLISIETNGSMSLSNRLWHERVSYVVDYKLDGSGTNKFMIVDKLDQQGFLTKEDYIKFVVCNEEDFRQAVRVHRKMVDRGCPNRFAYSPCVPQFKTEELCRLMQNEIFLKEQGTVLNVQIHKLFGLK